MKAKRWICMLTAAAMLLCLLPAGALAETGVTTYADGEHDSHRSIPSISTGKA